MEHQTLLASRKDVAMNVHEGTEDEFIIYGYSRNKFFTILYFVVGVLTAGVGLLLGYWYPIRRLKFTHDKCLLSEASSLLIKQVVGKRYFVSRVQTMPQLEGHEDWTSFEQSITSLSEIRYFEHMFLRYVLYAQGDSVMSLWGSESLRTFADFRGDGLKCMSGGSSTTKLRLYAENYINVPVKPWYVVFAQLCLDPFYVFQLFSVILWMNDDYVLYSCLIIIMTLASLIFNTYETKKNLQRLHDMIAKDSNVRVLRRSGGETTTIVDESSRNLVPGDILVIPEQGCEVPCDIVLLSGRCIVNESSLTGETIPTIKTCVDDSFPSSERYDVTTHKQHTIFNGTQIQQARRDADTDQVTAMVVRTGFYTLKGSLIRSIIFPRPVHLSFFRDSMRFILCMGIIALIGFFYTIYIFKVNGFGTLLIVKRALDLFTIVIPPALPATMSVGLLHALNRLRKLDIHCIDPKRVNLCGKIKLVVFDKTGTLTEDHLEVSGVMPVAGKKMGALVADAKSIMDTMLFKAMTACHNLSIIDDKPTGDPIDMYMFNYTGWMLKHSLDQSHVTKHAKYAKMVATSSENTSDYIIVLKDFTFDSALQRMSVVCQMPNKLVAFTKGSPEKILSMCRAESVPKDIERDLHSLTRVGHRVLAISYKELYADMPWEEINKLSREEVECDLTILGLIVFENVIKEGTHETVDLLTKANIRCVMATGDNLLTASYVAKELHMIRPHQSIYELAIQEGMEHYKLLQGAEDKMEYKQQTDVLHLPVISEPWKDGLDYVIVMNGKNYEEIRKERKLLENVLVTGAVFARMSPDQKTMLVQDLQSIGYGVGMCGDGANDCGALKAAHAGIALSASEASIAAPFTSKVFHISCVPHLISEGRAALATAFGTFKYMALYSFIQFFGMLILYSTKSSYSNNQFLYADLFLNLPLVFAMTQSKANSKLALKRPLGRLVHPLFIGSILGHVVLMICTQLLAFLVVQQMSWYKPAAAFVNKKNMDYFSYENTSVMTVSFFQYIWLSMVNTIGRPYRAPAYTNYIYVVTATLTLSLTLYITTKPHQAVRNLIEFVPLPNTQFMFVLLGISFAHLLLSVLLEWAFKTKTAKKLSDTILRKKAPRNAYKHILSSLVKSEWPKNM